VINSADATGTNSGAF